MKTTLQTKSEKSLINIDGFELLFILFLILKLTGVIDWSWWWVTAPLWIPLGLAVLILIVLVLWGLAGSITDAIEGDDE